jgi:hypothetical protein
MTLASGHRAQVIDSLELPDDTDPDAQEDQVHEHMTRTWAEARQGKTLLVFSRATDMRTGDPVFLSVDANSIATLATCVVIRVPKDEKDENEAEQLALDLNAADNTEPTYSDTPPAEAREVPEDGV